ncbi:MAG: ECF transporter S component, partial [Clostridia bacterium]|nr:ECF transporter S component [Clostridia bacterium]
GSVDGTAVDGVVVGAAVDGCVVEAVVLRVVERVVFGMYQAILPNVDGLLMCLIVFNMPFTLLKGGLDALITFLIYKRISPIIRGKQV